MGDLLGDDPNDLEGLDASAAHVSYLLSIDPANSIFFILSNLLKYANNSNVRRVYISFSLASLDGHVIGGGVGGMLIAASPVQVTL